MSLPHTTNIKSIEETERKLQYILDICKKYFVDITPPTNITGFV